MCQRILNQASWVFLEESLSFFGFKAGRKPLNEKLINLDFVFILVYVISKTVFLMLAIAVIAFAVIAAALILTGQVGIGESSAGFNFDSKSAVGSKIANATGSNPIRNIELNPFSDQK